jgi:hypothetical protein
MAITVDWDNDEKTTLRYIYTGRWNWDEYNNAVSRAHELVAGIDYPINVIADFSESRLMPDLAISGFKKSLETNPINFNIAVIVTTSELLLRLLGAFRRMYRRIGDKVVTVKTLDEARAVIAQRQTLHNEAH